MKHLLFRLGYCFLFLLPSAAVFSQNDSKELRDSYDFDYIYKLKMTDRKEDIQFDYYLKKEAGYFGFDITTLTKKQENMKMFTIIDNEKGVTAMFMEMMGKKMVQKSKLKLNDFDAEDKASDVTITQIGSKTILGYTCEGFLMEDKNSEITMYITNEAPVNFSKMWDNGKAKLPKGFDPSWMKKYGEKGLLMEMQYVDKKKSKNNITMECVGLEETNFSLQASAYGSMLSAFGK